MRPRTRLICSTKTQLTLIDQREVELSGQWRLAIIYKSVVNFVVVCLSVYYRAETILSGVLIRPSSDDPNSTRMSLIFQMDMKGWIPHFIVNAFAAKSPAAWHENLSRYYWNTFSKQEKSTTGAEE